MFWKVLAFVAVALLVVVVFASLMSVGAGAVSCTFDVSIWQACFNMAFVMLVLRIVVPIMILALIIKIASELRKKH